MQSVPMNWPEAATVIGRELAADISSRCASPALGQSEIDSLILAVQPDIRRLAWSFHRRATSIDVDDLVQVANEAVVKAWPKYDPAVGPFVAFAWTYAKYALADHIIKEFGERGSSKRYALEMRTRFDYEGELWPDNEPLPDRSLIYREQLRLALSGMSKVQRTVIISYYFYGFSVQSIEAALGATEKQVQQIIQSGKRRAAGFLHSAHGDDTYRRLSRRRLKKG